MNQYTVKLEDWQLRDLKNLADTANQAIMDPGMAARWIGATAAMLDLIIEHSERVKP